MKKVCIIVPCYNEEGRLPQNEFKNYLEARQDRYCFFVDDGNRDGTLSLLKMLQEKYKDQVRYLSLSINKGKGEAVRQGILGACEWETFDYIGYLDTDLSTPLE